MFKQILVFLILLCPNLLWAYPNFVGYGYQSCLTCHYNPFGNGPLTDYGRAVGATVVADRAIYSSKTTEDEIGKDSGFMYTEAFNSWARPSADYRGLYLQKNVGTTKEDSEWINMQASANLVIRLGPQENKDSLILVGTVGYAPTPRTQSDSTEANWRSREHYIGYRPSANWGIYLGLMDKVFGIRIADHVAFSRISTANTMNDQTHGLMLHYYQPEFEMAIHGFVGNLGQDKNIRQVGGSVHAEYSFNPKFRLGGSFLNSKSDFLGQTSFALFNKIQYGKGSSVLLEIGQTKRDLILQNSSKTSRYLMTQNHIKLRRGMLALITGEYYKSDIDSEDKIIRLGPGFQYFPFQGVELRADIFNSRIFSSSTITDDSWTLAGQVHLWF